MLRFFLSAPLAFCVANLSASAAMSTAADFPAASDTAGAAVAVVAAPGNPVLSSKVWEASWITCPEATQTDYGVFLFRKSFELERKPGSFVINVSADRRYRLYVNGTSVVFGPQRSDAFNWRYETIDIAPLLRPGKNVLGAMVWNYGEDAPYALKGVRLGLIVQGNGDAEHVINSDASWRVRQDSGYAPLAVDAKKLNTFIVVGPGDRVDGALHPWRWTATDYDDRAWAPAKTISQGTPAGVGTDVVWWLSPRNIPLMEETLQRGSRVRRTSGVDVPAQWLAGHARLTIPAATRASILLDQGFETNAFPHVIASGGAGAKVTVTYAEALVDSDGAKGNRNEIEGRHIIGVQDAFISGGGAKQDFSTLNFRTWRYVQLEVETGATPLVLDDFYAHATGYPFVEVGRFSSNDASLGEIWATGWRTARLCAFETYMDCPYYEQLQYVGDTRIQALISLYVSGDDRLMRNAIELYDQSRLPGGLTQSRYPSISPQIIPPFSLFWVDMVHDYWMHRSDDAFVRGKFVGIQNVLTWFESHVDAGTGMLGPLPYWCFVDWPEEWPWVDQGHPGGMPAGVREGGSSILTLQFAWTLDHAAELFRGAGEDSRAARYAALSARLKAATIERCWDPRRNMLADTPERTTFSQHANALAVLAGAIAPEEAPGLIRRVVDDASLTQCTLYFRFYLLRAMKKAGLGDEYVNRLGAWREMLARGLSTFAERPDPTRSDCHAWSASPCYEFLATVCGIEPAAPGFAKVKIEPHPGPLTHVEGAMPHPAGMIEVSLKRDGTKLRAEVTLPGKLEGEFRWQGKTVPLHPGRQVVE